jgi:hypothetical protein
MERSWMPRSIPPANLGIHLETTSNIKRAHSIYGYSAQRIGVFKYSYSSEGELLINAQITHNIELVFNAASLIRARPSYRLVVRWV